MFNSMKNIIVVLVLVLLGMNNFSLGNMSS